MIDILLLFLFQGDQPTLSLHQGQVLIRLPDQILTDEEVKRRLDSGLTATFVVTATTKGGTANSGAAKIEVRYELWEEVYLVNVLENHGKSSNYQFDSQAAFTQWWHQMSLAIFSHKKKVLGQLKITLEFIPFSQTEQNNARDWFADAQTSASRPVVEKLSQESPQLKQTSAFQTIMATSIKRKVLTRYQWRLPMPRR